MKRDSKRDQQISHSTVVKPFYMHLSFDPFSAFARFSGDYAEQSCINVVHAYYIGRDAVWRDGM